MSDLINPPKIIVVGATNIDLVVRCARLPQPGETVAALSYEQISGGKGANQAVAAAKAGADVSIVGRVGDDAFGQLLIRRLEQLGVDCVSMMITPQCESGMAQISVDDSGQNSIVYVEGANGRLMPADIQNVRSQIEASDTLLLQLEIPLETVIAAMQIAKQANVRVILDPAPVPPSLPPELYKVDLICPNESEAQQLTGIAIDGIESAEAVARQLYSRGARHVAITMAERGTLLFDEKGSRVVAPFPVNAVDTTAAGDAFAGALAVAWAEMDDLDRAVRFGNAAGALAASKAGAQPSMPSREELIGKWPRWQETC